MTRRLLGPAGGAVIFLIVAGLVFAGLGWVTVAALRVERERGEAAAAADRGHDLRAALWRLDARLLQALGVEDARPFHHYTRHEPGAEAVGAYGPASAPLLAAELPEWMLLHAEFDPDAGWRSPQVLPDEAADDLRARWPGQSLRNADPGRAKRYDALVRAYPKAHAARALAAQERALLSDAPFAGGLLFMGPPAPRSAGQEAARRVAAPKAAPAREDREDGVRLQRAEQRFEDKPGAVEKEAVRSGLGLPPMPAGSEQAPQTQPDDAAAGRSASRPDNRHQEFQSRANVIQRGADDAKRASNFPLYQNVGPQAAPATGSMALNATPAGPPPGGAPPGGPGLAAPAPAVPGGLGGGVGPGGPPAGGSGGTSAPKPAPGPPGAGAGGDSVALGGFGSPPAAAMKKTLLPPGAAGRAAMGDKSKLEGGAKVDSFAKQTPLADQENAPGRGAAPDAERKKKLDEAAGAPPAPADGAAGPFARGPEPGGRPGEPKGGGAADKTADRLRGGAAPAPPTGATPLAGALGRAVVPPAQPPTPAEQPPVDALEAQARLFAAEPAAQPPVAVHLGSMRPQWLAGQDGGDALFLVRAVRAGPKVSYQGVLLDWDRLKPLLLDEVKDLFPAADLVPVKDPAGVSPDRAMTALPVQLDPGPAPEPPPPGWTPLRYGLVLAWVAALVAVGAVGLAGWSLIDLSERRIRFVSAVTHELRTPLTSLRLYLDLLLSGMVTDEVKRTEYLATLNAESDRLHRLIDNVLDFARLERRRAGHTLRPVPVADLLGQIRQTWGDRCGADGKDLVVVSTLPPAAAACTDPDLFGQIVGNLVDNARKYSRGASDPRVWVWAKPAGRKRVAVEVEDRGPGVPPRERGLVFRPFRRGEGADTTAGGAGLGLALAKQWAEAVGGRLTYRPADGGVGACFRLELPAA